MKTEKAWGWPIAGYLFLGGLGGGTIVISSIADLFLGQGELFSMGCFITAVLIAIGSGLLVFELGKPLRFWRVFSTQKAIMTVGAWMLSLLIVTSFIQFTFWPGFSPWHSLENLRKVIAILNLFLGLGVCTYTGILLGSMKPIRFWNNPALPILFLISGLSTGTGMQALLVGSWPSTMGESNTLAAHGWLRSVDIILIIFEIIVLLVYVLMIRTKSGQVAERAANHWLTGSYALAFWGGVFGLGLVLPLVLYSYNVAILPSVCVLLGGVFLRFLVVYTNDRTFLPGEEKFLSRLPVGDEAFLRVK